ncbi:MAG: carboxypeptidase-like regulatory domain-containing protein [Chitinophagales bacterium]|nr:carboxypeptidase-like regulatory domain-containing protein [Chitinophagales bacterium]
MLLSSQHLFSQNSLPQILVTGTAIDSISKRTVSGVQIVNMKTLQRFYSDENGIFFFQCTIKDTLYVTSQGYSPFALCFKDSARKNSFTITIKLKRINVDLPEVVIGSKRSFAEINKDAQKLGYNKYDYMVHGLGNIMQSPFTYIYELLSKHARDERAYAELMNYSKKQMLLKELINKYNEMELLNIGAENVERFIDYANISDVMLKNTSEYDFIRYLQYKEVQFIRNDHRPLPPETH